MANKLYQGSQLAKRLKAIGISKEIRELFGMRDDSKTGLIVFDPSADRSWEEFRPVVDKCFPEIAATWEYIRKKCSYNGNALEEIDRAMKHIMRDDLTKKILRAENYNLNRENLVAIVKLFGLEKGQDVSSWSIRKLHTLIPDDMTDKLEDLLCQIRSVQMRVRVIPKSRGNRNVNQPSLALSVRRWVPVPQPGHMHIRRTLKIGSIRELEKMQQRITEFNDPRNDLIEGISKGNVTDLRESELAGAIDRLLSVRLTGRTVRRISPQGAETRI